MAEWLYGHNLALWLFEWPIWVSKERAQKMWQSRKDRLKIIPFVEKSEQKYSTGRFSFVYFRNSFVNTKWPTQVGNLTQIFVGMDFLFSVDI